VAQTSRGALVDLTLDPHLQEATEETLKAYQIPYAGAVVLSVPEGRVLAMVGRSEADPSLGAAELALAPWAPAASVFKLVSASAMVATGKVSSSSRVCYHGGLSSVLPENLIEQPARDTTCASLAYAIGKSQNAVIAKLAVQHLTPALLTSAAHALGFGEAWAFDLPVVPSSLDVPTNDSLELARTAAGFWHSTLSPFHGAVLAATMANKGEMPSPYLVARALGTEGQELPQPAHPGRRVLSAEVANQVASMMTLTTRMGTARHTFMDKNARPLLPVTVAGKTGTLSAETDRGHVGYSWFVGFAPAENPTIAFAIALGNGTRWRIKAAHVARQIVAAHLAVHKHKTQSVLASR
jgi:cell division protein FtsI/penicillin-binding protein 2